MTAVIETRGLGRFYGVGDTLVRALNEVDIVIDEIVEIICSKAP